MSRLSWRTTRKPASTSCCTKPSGQATSCMPSPMISRMTGRPSPPVSSTSICRPLAVTFIDSLVLLLLLLLLEFALAQPLGGDPFLAGEHRCAAVQRAGGGVGPVVAEEHAGAAHRGHFEPDVGEGGGAALLGFLQVHHERGHALAAALEDGGRAGLVRVEVV